MNEFVELLKSAPYGFSTGSLLALAVYSVLRGYLYPRSFYNSTKTTLETANALIAKERDDWKSAYQAQVEEAAELRKQNGALIEATKTTQSLIEALRAVTSASRNGGS